MHIGLTSLGLSNRTGTSVQSGPLGYTEPTLSDLAPYAGVSSVGGYTKYTNVPWGPAFDVEPWAEPTLGNQVVAPVMTIYMPNVAMPPGGYGLIVRAHANGSDHNITEGSGSLWTYLIEPAMAKGYIVATIEFRHPVANVSLGAPHTDTGFCLQFLRACASALNINTNRIHGFAQSRGNLLLWQTVSADLADAGNVSFVKRQSSKIKSLWGLNTQDSYSTTEFIQEKIVPADQAACLADPAYADDVRWGSAKNLIKTGTQELPLLCSTYDNPFLNALPSHQVGQYTKAAIDANANLRVHCPEFGQALWKAYAHRGQTSKITVCDDVSGGTVSMADCTTWFQILDEEPGISAKSARAQALQRRLGGTLHFLDNPAVGAYLSQATPTPITTVNTAFGVLIDGAWGAANRLNTSSPLGGTMVQSTATLRPVLKSLNMGRGFGFALDGVDDVFRIGLNNTTVDLYSFPILEAPVQGATSRTGAVVNVGIDKIANKTVSLIAAVPNATFGTVDLKLLRQFALELSGEDALDIPGGLVLADASTSFSPLTYTRSGPDLWCPQADGSLASFAANVIPREFAGGRWGFRFDPGWTQYVKASHALTDLGNWGPGSWVTVTDATGVVAPDGGVPSRIVPNATSSTDHLVSQSMSGLSSGVTYCSISVVKAAGYNFWRHRGLGISGSGGVCFDLASGTVVSLDAWQFAGVIPLKDGWKICWSVGNASAAVAPLWHIFPTSSFAAYSGDGVSGVLVRALNFTDTAYPAPITVAQGTVGTIGNHSCSALLSELGISLGAEYTLGCDWTYSTLQGASSHVARIADVGDSNRVLLYRPSSINQAGSIVISSTVTTYSSSSGASVGSKNNQAVRVKVNDMKTSINSSLGAASGTAAIPTGLDRAVLGHGLTSGANILAGSVSKFWISPNKAMSDTDLQTVTT